MAYTAPTAAELKAAFPAFDAVADETVEFWIVRANRSVDTSWTEGDYAFAIMLLACHLMTGAGLGTGTDAEIAAAGLSGVSRLKSGTLDVSFAGDGANSGDASGYGGTAYGRQFAALLKQNRGGPRVIASERLTDDWGALGIQNNGGIVPWVY